MLKALAIQHFGTATALARALNITVQAVSDWGDFVPEGRAYKLQVVTGGLLRVDPSLYDKDAKEAVNA
jgi:hypothetical protein